MRPFYTIISAFLITSTLLYSQTIEEKKEILSQKESGKNGLLLEEVNHGLLAVRAELDRCYQKSLELQAAQAGEGEFKELLGQIRAARQKKTDLEQRWRETSVNDSKAEDEGYALWDQEETTLSQLVMEYGAMDYVYVVPPEMAGLKLNIHSSIPVPRESWEDVLEIILSHNGIGVKKLNNYSRQLFVLKQNPSAVSNVASRPEDLLFIPPQSRLFYVFSPPIEHVKTAFQFFERFSDSKQTFVYQLGSKIALVAMKEEIEKLLTIFDSVWEGKKGKIARIIPVTKMDVKEMEKILSTFFGEAMEKARSPFAKGGGEGIALYPLNQGSSLVLIGSQDVVDRAESIVKETEEQMQDPAEMTVFLYSCKHSDPVELAGVLEKVYEALLIADTDKYKDNIDVNYTGKRGSPPLPDGYQSTPPLVVSPPPFNPPVSSKLEIDKTADNFIPDPKSGTVLMVVRRDALLKIKDLLRKLDVPKRMVQIEVLLFEKQLNSQNSMGMNLLRLGNRRKIEGADGNSFVQGNGVDFRGEAAPSGLGVFQYLLHHARSKYFPKIDLTFSFLMTQEDIQLNAAPSVVAVNQTPATISIQDEISINNGAAPIDTNKGIAFEQSYTRTQYGITIVMTPTIHLDESATSSTESKGSITLQTNITFDTPKATMNDRPPVNRRHIENEVRVADGETVIIGGLRKKNTQESEDRIPLLGEIPYLGKLFGSTKLIENNTEMFFFITPKIILDPKEELECIRREELKKRPGDLPEYLERLVCARECEKNRFFRRSLNMLFRR